MASPSVDGPSASTGENQAKRHKLHSGSWESVRCNSPEVRSRNGSPEPCCAICLGKPESKCFTNTCMHQFCFTCLKEWSKVKPECPLCKQRFKAIIHNIRSNEEYDEYRIKSPEPEEPFWNFPQLRFRYRTALSSELRAELAMQRLYAAHHFAQQGYLPTENRRRFRDRQARSSRLHGTSAFRRSRYERDLWAQPLSDITGRFREATPDFFRNNPAMTHRLVPWLNRELAVLMSEQPNRLAFVLELILGLLNRHHILSRAFRETMEPYTGTNTAHFIHEFYHFARSPYDMFGFDEYVQYGPRNQLSHEEVGISEMSESDIEVLSPQREARHETPAAEEPRQVSPQPGPSGLQRTFQPSSSSEDSDAEETAPRRVRQDSVSSGEVELVKVVKPIRERTPEIIVISDTESEAGAAAIPPEPTRECRGKSLKKRSRSPSSSNSGDSRKSEDEVRIKKKVYSSRTEKKTISKENKFRNKRENRRRHRRPRRSPMNLPREERVTQRRAPLRGYWDLDPDELEDYRSGSSTTSSRTDSRDKKKRSRSQSSSSEKKSKHTI